MSTGESQPADRDQHVALLARGRAVLARLKLEAEAARAEARRVELEQVLSQADQLGDSEHLRQWLASYELASTSTTSGPTIFPSSASIPQPHLSSRQPSSPEAIASPPPASSHTNDSSGDAPSSSPVAPLHLLAATTATTQSTPEVAAATGGALAEGFGWEQLLPQARQRLTERAQTLNASTGTRTQERFTAQPQRESVRAKTNEQQQSTQAPSADQPQRTNVRSNRNQQLRIDKPQPAGHRPRKPTTRQPQPTAKPATPIAATPLSPANEKQPDQQDHSEHKKPLVTSRVRGITTSVVAHILLALILAFMTLKLPVPPASLSFQSSSATATETFEISQPAEPTTAEVSESTELPEVATDLSESFDALTSDLSATLATTAVGMTSSPASVSSAVAAARSASSVAAAAAAGGSFFGAEASGNCFCYIIDSSGSMRGGAWEAAKAELSRSLDTLTTNQRFYIIFFNKQLDLIPSPDELAPAPNPMYATRENVQHAKRWIDTIRIDNGAPPMDALTAAIDLEPDAIYLLTDGVTTADVCAHLKQVNRVDDFINGELVKTPIHAIAYYSLKGEQLMRRVAAENNGQFIYVPKPK